MWWLSQLPRVLMATSSILLDGRLLLGRQIRNRAGNIHHQHLHQLVLVQVLLWLTATLPSSPLYLYDDYYHYDQDPSASPSFSSSSYVSTTTIKRRTTSNEPFFLWMNLIFFTNILVLVLLASLNTDSPRQLFAFPNNGEVGFSFVDRDEDNSGDKKEMMGLRRRRRQRRFCWNHILTLFCRGNGVATVQPILLLLSPCCWISMVWAFWDGSTMNGQSSVNNKKYGQVALAALAMALSLRFVWDKYHTFQLRRKSAQPHHQLISTPHIIDSDNHRPLDEGLWYQWSVSQVLQWLTLETQVAAVSDGAGIANGENETQEYLQSTILPRLAAERIDGSALESLDHEALRHMDIPYGIACRLLEVIQQRLVKRYPLRRGPHANRGTSHDEQRPDMERMASMLDQHDQDYRVPWRQRLHSNATRADPPLVDPDQNVQQHVRDRMRQFGLDMPEIRPAAVTPGFNNNDTTPGDVEPVLIPAQHHDVDSLPPHIREIVQRKPHLFEQLKAMHQEERQEIQPLAQFKLQESPYHHPQQPAISQTSSSVQATLLIPEVLLQSIPPDIREVGERNPELFRKMLRSRLGQNQGSHKMTTEPEVDERHQQSHQVHDLDEEHGNSDEATELTVLLPKDSGNGRLRQRPGF